MKNDIKLFREKLAVTSPSECSLESDQLFTKPAQLTKVRDILALYSTGQITPTLKTNPPEDSFRVQQPFANQQEAEQRLQDFKHDFANIVKEAKKAQNQANEINEVQTSPEDSQGD